MSEELHDWASRLAAEYRQVPARVEQHRQDEAGRLAAQLSRHAPRRSGALSRSFEAKHGDVLSDLPYARQVSDGGVIRARRHGFLTIPIRRGYIPGPGFVTVGPPGNRLVVRSGSLEVWAARRREVVQRGTGYLGRALEAHLEEAEKRTAAILPDVTGVSS